jgi:hypothetical protein
MTAAASTSEQDKDLGVAAGAGHTPGPWHVDGVRDINGRHLHIGAEGCVLSLASLTPTHVDTEANARLIAAAPDLLASERANLMALENIRAYLAKHADILPPMSAAGIEVRLEKTRAAIAKATGR